MVLAKQHRNLIKNAKKRSLSCALSHMHAALGTLANIGQNEKDGRYFTLDIAPLNYLPYFRDIRL